ncbi:MAG: hypothetical protein Q4A37_00880 [Candidatus Saccharibacteria bacterium]|nr:hypothetical protein [Candidatus Saccharibacteria bacterium]
MKQRFVFINGRAYDPITGLPVTTAETSAPAAHKPVDTAPSRPAKRGTAVHTLHKSQASRSTTLSRRHIKRPAAPAPAPIVSKKQRVRVTTATHANVKRFAEPVFVPPVTPTPAIRDRAAETHPVAHRAKARKATPQLRAKVQRQQALDMRLPSQTAAPQPTAPKPAAILKNEAIAAAMEKAAAPKQSRRQKKTRQSRGLFGSWMQTVAVGMAVMVLGGYFTYLSMPNISIRMAAIQSGVNAKYPGYRPDGYALRGPISFKNGEVSMKFAYAGGEQHYTLTQQKSNWDSAAVKEYAASEGEVLTTTMVDGLTIYGHGDRATWVNGGVLYQITSHAPLSSQQIQKIATSL